MNAELEVQKINMIKRKIDEQDECVIEGEKKRKEGVVGWWRKGLREQHTLNI